MLLQTVHLPRLYSDLPGNEAGAGRHCSQILALLRDMDRNCILLIDSDNSDSGSVMRREMFRGVHGWPQKYRRKGQELLRELGNRNRMIMVGNGGVMEVACGAPGCQHAVVVAKAGTPELVIGLEECGKCTSFAERDVAVIGINDYPLSSFVDSRKEAETIALTDGEWDRAEFEQRVWQPLFQYAKHVKIFDRHIGRHLQQEGDRFNRQMGNAYAASIEWVFGQFASLSAGRAVRSFEVTCGLQSDKLSDENRVGAAEVLRSFAGSLSAKYGLKMEMNVKVEKHDAEMPHDRCIITDQIAVSVSRGFDLLKRNGRVRDVVIGLLPNRGEIERQARPLPNVPST